MIERAIAMLEEQQSKVRVRSPQWMVAEQLKDICRQEPHCAELIAQDLEKYGDVRVIAVVEKTPEQQSLFRREGG